MKPILTLDFCLPGHSSCPLQNNVRLNQTDGKLDNEGNETRDMQRGESDQIKKQ